VKTDLIDHSYAALATAGEKRPRRRWPGRFIGVLAIAVAAVVSLYLYAPQYLPARLTQLVSAQTSVEPGARARRGGRRAAAPADAPVPVLVTRATQSDIPIYFDGVGSSKALNTVTVRAQVDGKLMSMDFKEGQDVAQNDVLAEIDATIYQAQYDQAVAKKAQDEAQLANARLDLERYFHLSQSNSGTKQQYDTQKALVAQLEAQVQGDQGAIENAAATLSYTKITAPLAGRTGIRQVDAGNIVHAADTTGIVVITQLRPIAVIFTLPQQELPRVNRAFAKGSLSVQALGDDNRTVIDRGSLEVIDNQVDQTTGTVKLKAEFPNADLALWPGQFVNVKLLVDTLDHVTVIPSAAVQRGPNGTFIYRAEDDGTASVHPVTVAQQDEDQAVITAGVAAGEKIVTTGFGQLADGTRISIGEQEDFDRPAGSERRRRVPRRGGAVANQAPAIATPVAAVTPAATAGVPPGLAAPLAADSATPAAIGPPGGRTDRGRRAERPDRPLRSPQSSAGAAPPQGGTTDRPAGSGSDAAASPGALDGNPAERPRGRRRGDQAGAAATAGSVPAAQ
jgi:multidrug efflux system membrane fusion protein